MTAIPRHYQGRRERPGNPVREVLIGFSGFAGEHPEWSGFRLSTGVSVRRA
jgi:hypothetical protein